MRNLYIADTEVFQERFETNLISGTYLWIDDNHIIYNENHHDIFTDIDFDEITEFMPIEITKVDLVS